MLSVSTPTTNFNIKYSPVLSVRPKIAELVYQLYGRSLHPELFEIHQSRTVERGAYKATVQITSAGHLVAWQYRGLLLTEVAAGVSHPLPQRRRLMSYRLKGDELYVRAVVTSTELPDNPVFENQKQQAWTQPVGWEERLAGEKGAAGN